MALRLKLAGAALLASACLTLPAHAGSVLDRVHQRDTVQCGATERPGLAGEAGGLLAELCRAVAAAALGPSGKAVLHIYDSDLAFNAVREGSDDIFFLGADDVVEQHLAGRVVPGPAVFYQTMSVLVKDASPVQHVADLAGQSICFPLGDAVQRNVQAWFEAHGLSFIPMGYQEHDEMTDAFDAGQCKALVQETTDQAEFRLASGKPQGRLLPEALTAFPILAMTPTADGGWSALVGWTMNTLIAADTPVQHWAAGGVDALLLDAPELGLTAGWQARMVAATGNYDEIVRRTLGEGSRYQLPAALNGSWRAGGLMLAPHAQ